MVPVCIAISWSCYVIVVGAWPVMERARRVVVPVLGFEGSSFVLPRTWRMSVPLVDMEDRSLAPKEGFGGRLGLS